MNRGATLSKLWYKILSVKIQNFYSHYGLMKIIYFINIEFESKISCVWLWHSELSTYTVNSIYKIQSINTYGEKGRTLGFYRYWNFNFVRWWRIVNIFELENSSVMSLIRFVPQLSRLSPKHFCLFRFYFNVLSSVNTSVRK